MSNDKLHPFYILNEHATDEYLTGKNNVIRLSKIYMKQMFQKPIKLVFIHLFIYLFEWCYDSESITGYCLHILFISFFLLNLFQK